jgi:geranylgeranyl diphosphate synthase type I
MDVFRYLSQKVRLIERELDRWVPKNTDPKGLAKAARHLLEAGGKRLRPCLLLISCEAVGGKAKDAIEAAVALELLHNFTLIHDDIMDHDEFRRNVKTVHVLWGEPMAIIAGDALFAKVFEALSTNVKRLGLSGAVAAEIFDKVSRASFEVCQGQAEDMLLARRKSATEEEYLRMVGRKTGALMRASTEVGVILGRGTPRQVRALGLYGRFLGMAFQLRDDVLGISGESRKFGKPIGSDIREGKCTLVVVKALSTVRGKDRKTLLKILGNPDASEKQIEWEIGILKESGAVDYASKKAEELSLRAKSGLEILPSSDAKEALLRIADFVVQREF